MTPVASTQPRPRIVIIGAGFGGLSVAKQLAQAPFEVTIVDRHNYHLFRNRLLVAMNWCWSYVTFQRGTRLITGISSSRIEDVMPVLMTAPPTVAGAGDMISGQASATAFGERLHRQRSAQHA